MNMKENKQTLSRKCGNENENRAVAQLLTMKSQRK